MKHYDQTVHADLVVFLPQQTSTACLRSVMPRRSLLVFLFSFPAAVFSDVSFPITAPAAYTDLSPCAATTISEYLNSWPYDGCGSATPISAYGSCLCAQRINSVQFEINLDLTADPECSETGVSEFLTQFCSMWHVTLGADIASATAPSAEASTTPAEPGVIASPTLGSHSHAVLTTPKATSTSTGTSGGGGGGLSDEKIGTIAGVIGAAASVLAVVVAVLAIKRKQRKNHQAHEASDLQTAQRGQFGHNVSSGTGFPLSGTTYQGGNYSPGPRY